MEEEIIEYLESKYPEEGCGIIVNKRGKLVWLPCDNLSDDPLVAFKIDPKQYVKASVSGDIHAIVHSHVNGKCRASEFDKSQSDHLQLPYHIYTIPEKEKCVYTPKYKNIQLLGRVYEFGKTDCWTLVRDYYLENFKIVLPMLEFETKFYDKGINYFEDLIEPWGGVEVSSPKKGDIIYFQIANDIPNHCGVYLDNDTFIHHQSGRLSCRDFLPKWQKYIKSYIRCKKFI
jgi:proteasome lid subunit RPN8/RPN11